MRNFINFYNLIILLVLFCISGCEKEINNQGAEHNSAQAAITERAEASGKENQAEEKQDTPKKFEIIKNFSIDATDVVFGDRDAKIILIEYFSPTCPHCASYHNRVFPQLKEKYIDTKKIAYVMREFLGNKQDLDGAILARCKGNDSDYLKFMTILLEQQSQWAFNRNYRDILTNIGMIGMLPGEKFAKCLQDEALRDNLIANTRLVANDPSFIGPPTFYINGQKHGKGYSINAMSEAIDKELAKYQ